MPETTQPSKEAMEAASKLRSDLIDGFALTEPEWLAISAAALEAFAAERTYDVAHGMDHAVLRDRDALLARNVALVAALKLGLSAIDMDDDMFHIDGVAVAEMEAALAADAKA